MTLRAAVRVITACLLLACPVGSDARAGDADVDDVENGRVRGTLVHKETGLPVIGAPVQMDGERFAVSDEAGVFRFDGVAPGRHRLEIDDPECAPFDASFEVVAGRTTRLGYALDPRGKQDVEEVIIRSERLEQEVSDTVLEMDEVKKIPGTQGDVLKIVQSLPGVARNLAFGAGGGLGVIIRGASPEDSIVLIDDHNVPLLYHFGGLKSVLNSDMLKRIDFLPGGFGAEYGQAIGGVVDVQTLSCTHEQYDGYVELSMLDAGFFVMGPVGEDVGFVAAARRSTVDLWLPHVIEGFDGFELTVAPVYYDYQVKLDWSPTPGDRLSLLAFGSSDELRLLMEKPPTGDAAFRGDFGMLIHFHRVHLRWTHAPQASDWDLRLSLVGGWDHGEFDAGPYFMRSEIPSLRLRADVTWQISRRWKLLGGVRAGLIGFDLSYLFVRPPKEGTIPGQFHTLEEVEGGETWLVYDGGAYMSVGVEPMDGMLISGGVRFDGYRYGDYGDWAVMPRLTFKHELRDGTIFKAGVGLYYQAPGEDELSENFGNPDLEMERAVHYTLGIEQELPFKSSLDLTFFYKSLDRLSVPDEEKTYSNAGIGKVAGLEILLRRELAGGLFGWLAYTLMRSQRRDGPGKLWRLFSYDQTHILTLVAGYQLFTSEKQRNHGQRSGWEFGLRFQLVSGNPSTPILGGIFDADYDTWLPIPGPVNSERMPLYHRLDLRVDYTWAFVYWALSVFLDVQNVYNYQSIEGMQYNYDFSERAYFRGLPILPALGVRGSF